MTRFSAPTGIEVITDVSDFPPGGERIRVEAYYLISEAVQNIIKHSEATQAWISVAESNGVARIDIEDNGRGWVGDGDRQNGDGNGLHNMKLRVALLNGVLRLERSSQGGAAIRMRLPLGKVKREDNP